MKRIASVRYGTARAKSPNRTVDWIAGLVGESNTGVMGLLGIFKNGGIFPSLIFPSSELGSH